MSSMLDLWFKTIAIGFIGNDTKLKVNILSSERLPINPSQVIIWYSRTKFHFISRTSQCIFSMWNLRFYWNARSRKNIYKSILKIRRFWQCLTVILCSSTIVRCTWMQVCSNDLSNVYCNFRGHVSRNNCTVCATKTHKSTYDLSSLAPCSNCKCRKCLFIGWNEYQ